MEKSILQVQGLRISFAQYGQGLHRSGLDVIRDLSLSIREGELVAVVGSSGSGKSLLAHAILGILPYNAVIGGEIHYREEPLTQPRMEALRGKEIALVPQSVTFLDPLIKVGPQVRSGRKDRAVRERCRALFARYGLGPQTQMLYPFQLSGGMARRVLISTAMMETPRLVIADEPTPGLPPDTARRVLGHFRELADDGAGVLLITHDLELAVAVADRIVVFYAGVTVEDAPAGDFAREDTLRHPYTRALRRAMPQYGFKALPGIQPYAGEMPEGCPFSPRCALSTEKCTGDIPYRAVRGGYVRCLYGEGTA